MLNQEKRNIPGRKRESVCVQISWKPTEKIGLKWFKELMVVYGMYSLYVRQNLNNWATQNRIISKDWKKLMITGTQNTLVTNCLSTLSVKGPPVQSVRRDQSRASGETRAECQWLNSKERGRSFTDSAWPSTASPELRIFLFFPSFEFKCFCFSLRVRLAHYQLSLHGRKRKWKQVQLLILKQSQSGPKF